MSSSNVTCILFLLATIFCMAGAGIAQAQSSGAGTLNALLPAATRDAGSIAIATDPHYPPCEFLTDDDQTMVGFEPDLWTALGEKLGVRIKVTSTEFSGLIAGVQSGRYLAAMECISDSAAREKQVVFVDYAYATSAVYTLASNTAVDADPLSLCGLRTAAQAGSDSVDSLNTISARCVKNARPAAIISQFPSADAVFSALVAGRVDFVLNDAAAADETRKQLPVPIRTVPDELLPRFYIGLIVLPQSTQLAAALLAALHAIQKDGTYSRIMTKWHIGALALDDAGLNLATVRPLPVTQP